MHRIFFVFIFGFVSGIALRSFFSPDPQSAFGGYFIFPAFLFLIAFCFFILFYFGARNKLKILFAVFLLATSLGIIRLDFSHLFVEDSLLENNVSRTLSVSGIITDEPDEREPHTLLVLTPQSVFIDGEEKEIKEKKGSKILLFSRPYPERYYGDMVRVNGILEKPNNFVSETGKEFNYVDFLAKDGIYYQMFYPDIEFLEGGHGNIIKEYLLSFKRAFLSNVAKVIPEPGASLLGGLVVGAKQSLGTDLLDDFRTTGIIHIVVLSGYNVTIVAEAIMRFFAFVPSTVRLLLGAGSILGFMVMVGAGATIVRATIMALLVILARATGRIHEITIALFLAGFIMLLVNPRILIFDPSFQLSFLATLGLIYLAPQFEKYFSFITKKFQLREFATATIATQIFVLPLLLFMTGEISLVALPVNLLILAFIPITMLFGFLTGVFGFLGILPSVPFAYITHIFLSYELKIVEIFSMIPFASISISHISFGVMLLVYALYAYAILQNKK